MALDTKKPKISAIAPGEDQQHASHAEIVFVDEHQVRGDPDVEEDQGDGQDHR